MDFVHIWYDDSNWFKFLHSTIPIHLPDLKVKVTDLEFLCLRFALKILGPHFSSPLGGFCSY